MEVLMNDGAGGGKRHQRENLKKLTEQLRGFGICELAEDARVEIIPGGFILVEREHARVLFHHNARAEEVLTNLELHGLLRRCVLGCVQHCRRR